MIITETRLQTRFEKQMSTEYDRKRGKLPFAPPRGRLSGCYHGELEEHFGRQRGDAAGMGEWEMIDGGQADPFRGLMAEAGNSSSWRGGE